MINKVIVYLIELYQKYLSPYKGYRCAYAYYTGKMSCSEFTKQAINKYGLIKGYKLHRMHINKCRAIYIIEADKQKSKENVDVCNEMAGVCACL